MTPQQFDKLAADPNPEALCHAVHIETGDAIVDYYVDLRSNPRRIAYYVEVFFGLICNGGFDALFTGAYSWTVRYSADALRTVGLDQYATMMENVVKRVFPDGIPASDEEMHALTDQLWDDFEDSQEAEDYDDPFEICEAEFWELYRHSKSEFRIRLHSYILAHKEAFCTETL